jgi:hypothetical protein
MTSHSATLSIYVRSGCRAEDYDMKSHFAASFADASAFNETADDQVWRQHRLPPASRRGNALALAVLAGLFVLTQLAANYPAQQAAVHPGTQPGHVDAASASGGAGAGRPAWLDASPTGRRSPSVVEHGDSRDRSR